MLLFDSSGNPMHTPIPKVLSAAFCRSTYLKGNARVDVYDSSGVSGVAVRHELVRAQVPHLVTLLVYSSRFQLQATTREYFVYAPTDVQHSVKLAFKLWRRWEKPARLAGSVVEDIRDDYPKVDDAAVSEPIDDAFFQEMWLAAATRAHKCAGDPRDPFAFTCLDPSVKVYRTADFQKDLQITV